MHENEKRRRLSEAWQRPGERERRTAALREAMSAPAVRAKIAASQAARWRGLRKAAGVEDTAEEAVRRAKATVAHRKYRAGRSPDAIAADKARRAAYRQVWLARKRAERESYVAVKRNEHAT